MRPELKEFKYDWMLWSAVKNAKNMFNATDKEIEIMKNILPGRSNTLDVVRQLGSGFSLLADASALWLDDLTHAKEKGKKVVLTTYCYPVGIMQAFDCVPLNLELLTAYGNLMWERGIYEFLDYCCEVGMTETSCSGQRGSLGAYLAGCGTQPDFCLCNTAGICDSNANAFHFFTSYKNIPMYMHDSPPVLTGERATEYHRQDFRRMLVFLEKQTGKKMNWDKLREVAQEIKKQDELINEIQSMVALVPSPVPPLAQAVIYLMKFGYNGLKSATPILEEILRISKENLKLGRAGTLSGKEAARCLTVYIDHYTLDFRFFSMFNKYDISTVGCMLDYFFPKGAPYAQGREDQCYDMDLSTEDAIIDSLADQLARMPMIKQIRGPYDAPAMWLEDTKAAVKLYKADCGVYLGTLGCRNTWGMVKPFARDMEKDGFPTYVLFADVFDDRIKSWDVCEKSFLEFFRLRKIIK